MHLSVAATVCGTAVSDDRRSTIYHPSIIYCCFDYCNSLLTEIVKSQMKWLHAVQLGWCLGHLSPWPCHTMHYCLTFIGCQWDTELSSKPLSLFGSVFSTSLQSTCKSYALQWLASVVAPDQTTVCIIWLHSATKRANACCTTDLCLQWTGSVEQSASNTAFFATLVPLYKTLAFTAWIYTDTI